MPQLLLQPIVENAVEHGISRQLHGGSIRLRTIREGDRLRITVEDDGPGPDAAPSSPGIGIANTRERLARLYGGRAHLTLESRGADQSGTRVELSLPFEPYVACAASNDRYRIVIVDDEPLAREGLRDAIARVRVPGVEVVALCEDGVTALDRIRELQPEILFLDIAMPVLDGFAMLEQLEPEGRRRRSSS